MTDPPLDHPGNPPAVLTRADFRYLLTATVPHASQEEVFPQLNAVRIEIPPTDPAALYAIATDRYSIAVARVPTTGGHLPAAATVGLTAARDMLHLTRRDTDRVLVTVTDSAVTVDAGPDRGRYTAAAMEPHRPGAGIGFPRWRVLLAGLLEGARAELTDAYAIDPALLARFAAATRNNIPLSVRFTSSHPTPHAGAPIVTVTCGQWFTGAAMPMRVTQHRANTPAGWDFWRQTLTTGRQQTAA